MSLRYVSPHGADAREGAMIWILAVVVGLALLATVGMAVVLGGIELPQGQAGLYAPVPARGATGPLAAVGEP